MEHLQGYFMVSKTGKKITAIPLENGKECQEVSLTFPDN